MQSACSPGPLPGTGSRRSGHFCPDTKEEEASSPALPSDLFLWVYTRPLGHRTPFQPRQLPRQLGLSHALVKERRRHDEGGEGFTPCFSLRLRQATGPICPNLRFPRRKMPLETLFYEPLLFGRVPQTE